MGDGKQTIYLEWPYISFKRLYLVIAYNNGSRFKG